MTVGQNRLPCAIVRLGERFRPFRAALAAGAEGVFVTSDGGGDTFANEARLKGGEDNVCKWWALAEM